MAQEPTSADTRSSRTIAFWIYKRMCFCGLRCPACGLVMVVQMGQYSCPCAWIKKGETFWRRGGEVKVSGHEQDGPGADPSTAMPPSSGLPSPPTPLPSLLSLPLPLFLLSPPPPNILLVSRSLLPVATGGREDRDLSSRLSSARSFQRWVCLLTGCEVELLAMLQGELP